VSQVVLSTEHVVCGPHGCTGVSSQLGEPLLGTAPYATAWLLLVHPGPWPATAPSGLVDSVVADELSRRCAQHSVRMAAIRRPATSPEPGLHGCYVASTQPADAWIERAPLAEPKDLLDLDIEAIAHGIAPGIGERVAGPLYAVCTHGKRDACCAANGRPVQRAIERLAPGRVWESTHLGGHRFAANVLVLPEGVMYGRVDQADVSTLVETHARGAIVPALWRGRSGHPQAAQAAEWFARRATGLLDIDAIAIERVDGNEDVATVSLHAGAQSLTVLVERVTTGCTRITGCAGDAVDPGRWRLVSMA
jgi:hypothetical protein